MIAPGQSAMGGGLLGVLSPGEKRLTGKSFYLDNVKRRPAALLVEAIVHLGGKVESFLHKDVTFVVTGSQEALTEGIRPIKMGANEGRGGTPPPRDGVQDTKERPWPTTPRPARPTCFGSRGMALLEKAIRNNERLQGSSVLQNARSWGVQILYVDDILLFLQRLTKESFISKHRKAEQKNCSKAAVRVKAACLKSPYLKVEDISRKYKPLYVQSLSFPNFCCLEPFGPSEPLPSPCPEKRQEQDQDKNKDSHKLASGPLAIPYPPLALKPSPRLEPNLVQGYCECCLEAFSNQEEHIVSAKHRRFLQDNSHYSALDQLVASLLPGFDPNPPQHTDPSLDSLPTTSACPSPGAADLVTLSDAETEEAVNALLNPLSTFDEAFKGLPHGPCPSAAAARPVTASPASHQPSAPILAALLAAPRPPSPCTWLWSPDPPTLTPCSPVRQPPELERLSPVSDRPSDPHSQPPVLTAVALGSCDENLVLYSDPPLLSPEIPILSRPTRRDAEAGCSEVNHRTCAAAAAQPACANHSSGRVPCRASSVPRMSRTTSKSGKRSRSASPRGGSTKRMRLACSSDQLFCSTPQTDTVVDLPMLSQINADSTVPQTCAESDPKQNFSCGPVPPEGAKDATKPTFTLFVLPETKTFSPPPGCLTTSHSGPGDQPPSPISLNTPDCSFSIHTPTGFHNTQSSQLSLPHSLPHSLASLCVDSALMPDIAGRSPSSSELDWDHELLSRLAPAATTPANSLPATRGRCGLDQELLQRHCTWTHNSSYEARLHSALQPATTSGRVL